MIPPQVQVSSSYSSSSSRRRHGASSYGNLQTQSAHVTEPAANGRGATTTMFGLELVVNGFPAEVSFDAEGLRWVPSAGHFSWQNCFVASDAPVVVPFSEMLCAQRLEPGALPLSLSGQQLAKQSGIAVHTFLRKAGNKSFEWHPWRVTLESANEELVHELLSALSEGITAASSTRPSRLLVVLNPNAGSGAARTHYRTVVQPVFSAAGISTRVVETQRAGHAAEMVRESLLAACSPDGRLSLDGVVAVGGDGVFHEIMNGLIMAREEDAAVAARPALALLRLAHIPCGSTDAVACSLNGCRSVFTAAVHVALGDSTPLDALKVTVGGVSRYSCCIATYGFMGDVVEASERHRWLGPLRYDLVGASMLLMNQSYRCRVSYLPPNQSEGGSADRGQQKLATAEAPSGSTACLARCPVCRAASLSRSQLDLMALGESGKGALSALLPAAAEVPRVSHASGVNGERKGSSGKWRVLEGEWMSIMMIVQPCRTDKTPHGMARHGHLANGVFTLVLVRKCNPLRYLQFLSTMSSSGLVPGQLPGTTEVLDAVACRVEGLAGSSVSRWNVDGELMQGVDMEAHMHLGMVQCFARGVETC